MDGSYHHAFEQTDVLLGRYTAEIRTLGLEFFGVVKDAVSVDPRAGAEHFGLKLRRQGEALTTIRDENLVDLANNGGLPYDVVFNAPMLTSIYTREDKTQQFNEAVAEAVAGERFGTRKVSWQLRELTWRNRHWHLCRELLRVDMELGRALFRMGEHGEAIARMTSGELLGLTLASKGRLHIAQSIPSQLATVLSDAGALQQIILTYRMSAGMTSTCAASR